jgi:hypothetical protein
MIMKKKLTTEDIRKVIELAHELARTKRKDKLELCTGKNVFINLVQHGDDNPYRYAVVPMHLLDGIDLDAINGCDCESTRFPDDIGETVANLFVRFGFEGDGRELDDDLNCYLDINVATSFPIEISKVITILWSI